ncbi:hypothetical protein NDU88_004323 [Pleurodeles waltl]|uniref:Uncharacterized protein n=1 Tax=Pleurodeles waltl TaxID=8319 RepID=A0AAV7V0Y5_PLEWA|nr:hypothetical protein NDU88_004323 [Pleurodeles waltl]
MVADCLSRLPIDGSGDGSCDMQLEAFSIDVELALGEDEWEEAVRNDVEYDELRRFVMGEGSDDVRSDLKQYLMGREPGTKESPWWRNVKKQVRVDQEDLKARAVYFQRKNKMNYDKRKSVKNANVESGDLVALRKVGIIKKGESKFYEPQKVVSVKNSVVKLEDGREWRVGNLCK